MPAQIIANLLIWVRGCSSGPREKTARRRLYIYDAVAESIPSMPLFCLPILLIRLAWRLLFLFGQDCQAGSELACFMAEQAVSDNAITNRAWNMIDQM
jgi:hypothetical protein